MLTNIHTNIKTNTVTFQSYIGSSRFYNPAMCETMAANSREFLVSHLNDHYGEPALEVTVWFEESEHTNGFTRFEMFYNVQLTEDQMWDGDLSWLDQLQDGE